MSTAQAAATGDEHSTPLISTVAGTGFAGTKGDKQPAVWAELNLPFGLAVDSTGTLYLSEAGSHRVRKITTDGRISTVAGTGSPGPGGDENPAIAAQLNAPGAVVVDSAGTLYIADSGNHRVRKITADGRISTVAGTGEAGSSGDGGPATTAQLDTPSGVAVDSNGIVYVSETQKHRVRKITTDGTISMVAGTGSPGSGGDGDAQLKEPRGLAVDSAGTLYIADSGNHRVRKITADGTISTVAGTGKRGTRGDGGLATEAQLGMPIGLVVDSTGALYIADALYQRVRKVAADGTISRVAGEHIFGTRGDGGPATEAQLFMPGGLAVDNIGALYIAERGNHRVRKVASARTAGLPDSGTVVSWTNARSKLRMGVLRESTKDGAEIHQALAGPRAHQRWRLVVAGQENGDILYRIENIRSGKVLEVLDEHVCDGAVVAQRAYEGDDARHQQWRLIPMGSGTDTPRVYEIANHHSGLLLRVDTNAPTVIKQHAVAEGDPLDRQWQLLPV